LSKIVILHTWAGIVSSRGREKTRDERWLTDCMLAALFLTNLSKEIARTECGPAAA
jgi:hypothetical protein